MKPSIAKHKLCGHERFEYQELGSIVKIPDRGKAEKGEIRLFQVSPFAPDGVLVTERFVALVDFRKKGSLADSSSATSCQAFQSFFILSLAMSQTPFRLGSIASYLEVGLTLS